jgi:hypothetical protein
MQIRRASFPADSPRPPCPFDHEDQPCFQTLGHYERYSQPDGSGKTRIPRLLCKFTGKTVSILPDEFLPYRSVNVPVVQAHFDQLTDTTPDIAPAPSEVQLGCLTRAWKRFTDTDRVASLTDFFGQRLPRANSSHALWKAMRNAAGQLGQILLDLAEQGKSLLGDYRCLKLN